MKKEDVYKKVDAMLKRFKKEAGESANRFPMKSEVSFKEWKGKRLYIKVDLTDACDEHRRYECGYIDLSTEKYSSKGATLSLVRPNYELLKLDFSMLPPPDDEVNEMREKLIRLCICEEEELAKKEGRKPRKVIDFDFDNERAVYDDE